MQLKKNYVIFNVLNRSEFQVIKDFNYLKIPVDIIRGKSNVYYKISYVDFTKTKENFSLYDICIIRYAGFIYWYKLFRKYYLAIIELFISIIIVFITSFFIVDIDIESNDKVIKELVKNALKEEKIYPFTIKKSYNQLQLIKDKIKDIYQKDIDWIEITNVGMKYIVNVEKRIQNNIEYSPSYCNIYAKKDGMVKRVKTYQGISNVAMNDYVRKGDLLISGDIKLNEETIQQVCANGVVYAEVWYIVNVDIPLNYYEYEPINKIRNNIIIEYDDKEYPIFKNRLVNYKSSKSLIWEILGIKIYKRVDNEVRKISKKYTYQEAIDKAIRIANDRVKIKLEKDEKIVKQKVLQKQVIDSTIKVDIFIITEEKIGVSNIEGW